MKTSRKQATDFGLTPVITPFSQCSMLILDLTPSKMGARLGCAQILCTYPWLDVNDPGMCSILCS